MLDQLKTLVKEYADESIIKNPAVPEQHKLAVIKNVTEQIYYGLKEQVKAGNIDGITDLFRGRSRSLYSDPLIKHLVGLVSSSLTSKFGLTSFESHRMAIRLVPDILDDFVTLKESTLQDNLLNLGAEIKISVLAGD